MPTYSITNAEFTMYRSLIGLEEQTCCILFVLDFLLLFCIKAKEENKTIELLNTIPNPISKRI